MLEIGTMLSGRYEVLKRVGSGGMADVYMAKDHKLNRNVAVKVLKSEYVEDEKFLKKFETEAQAVARLSHPNIVNVYDVGIEDGINYIVMELAEGMTLKEYIRRKGYLSPKETVEISLQIASAISHAHKNHIIHRDIKPQNILVSEIGNVKVTDFGIAKATSSNTVTSTATAMGSVHYISPEQAKGRFCDEKSDIYSTGATLFHLITGKKAGRNRTKAEEYLLKNYVSEAFAAVILKAMDPKSEKRYKNAREMFQALQNVYKKDARYRKLVIGQRVAMLGLVAGMGLSIIAIGYGIHTMKLEKVNRYNEIVKQQTEYRKSGEYEKEEAQYQKAINLLPAKEESYYQNACALYEQKEYQDCIDFIDYDIFQNEKVDLSDDRIADLYYLKAESCFELEDYGEAVKAFKKVFQHGGQKSEFYRDYAIALAYNDELDKAKEVLDHAEDYQIADDSLLYARGEIEKSSGNTAKAEEAFRDCISKSENEELIMRSYVMLSELAKDSGNLSEERNVLQEAKEVLPVSRQMVILERLIQVDIDLSDAGKTSYRNEAIELLQEVIDQGWDTYETYNNLVILNEKQGNLTEAQNALDTMKEQFGDDYNIEKRAAFLEIDKQEQKANKNRDYTAFAEYYEKAEKMYYEQLKNNDTDAEMDLLENVYQQVRSGGWIEE